MKRIKQGKQKSHSKGALLSIQRINVPKSLWAPTEEPCKTFLRMTKLNARREWIYAPVSALSWFCVALWDVDALAILGLCICQNGWGTVSLP